MHSKIHKSYDLSVFPKMLYTATACLFLTTISPSCKKELADSKTTGRSTTLALISSPGSTVGGSVTIAENKDQSYNITIDLSNTVKDSIIYIDVHNGLFADPFEKQANDFGTIVGTGATASKTLLNISKASLPDQTRITVPYDSLLTFKGFINVSLVSAPHNTSQTIAHVMLGH